MPTLAELTTRLVAGQNLDAAAAHAAALALATPGVPDAEKAEFLTAFADRG